jgi:hypothetical protein
MLPEIVHEIPNTRHFGYPKCRVQVSGNPFYLISMLLIVKKEVNLGEKKQIRSLIIHIMISDSRIRLILNEQSSRDRNPCLTVFESST